MEKEIIMGCGCSKNKSNSRRVALSPNRLTNTQNTPQISVQSLNSNSNNEIRALGFQSNTSTKSPNRLDADKRRIEQLRREAVRKALNK